MIPKIVHYCWFGNNEKSDFTKRCIDSWKRMLPDYKFIEWNEHNCDIDNSCEFVKSAYELKKYAFVSDYFRMKALYDFGGVYLDTDVLLLSDFDKFLEQKLFMCFEDDDVLCTAVIGANKGNEYIGEFLNTYTDKTFNDTPNSKLLYDFLGLKATCKRNVYSTDGFTIYPFYYFSPLDYYTRKDWSNEYTVAVHYYGGTWKSGQEKLKEKAVRIFCRMFGVKFYKRVKSFFRKDNNED